MQPQGQTLKALVSWDKNLGLRICARGSHWTVLACARTLRLIPEVAPEGQTESWGCVLCFGGWSISILLGTDSPPEAVLGGWCMNFSAWRIGWRRLSGATARRARGVVADTAPLEVTLTQLRVFLLCTQLSSEFGGRKLMTRLGRF